MGDATTTSEDWLRAENWQSVLADPETLPAAIRDHLAAENALTEAALGGHSARADLREELKACIRDRDDSVPIDDGPYCYWQRYQAGAEHPDVVRQSKTDDVVEVLLCGDRRAHDHPYYDLANTEQSPDHQLFAITEDCHGAERYTLTILQAGTDDAVEEPLEDLRGDFEWTTDSRAIVYTRLDAHQRPSSVWCHTLGTPQATDHCLLTLDDPGRFIGLGKTSSERFLTIDIHDHQTTQTYLLPADLSRRDPWPVTAWIEGLEYDLEDSGDALVIKANWGHKDFQLFCCPYPDNDVPGHPDNWRCLWTPEPGTLFSDFEILATHWVLEMTREGIPHYQIATYRDNNFALGGTVPLATDIHDASLDALPGFDRTMIRLRLSTPRQPTEVLDIDLLTGEKTLRKRTDPPSGHHEDHYRVERRYAVASDGTPIPLTLVYHADTSLDSETPIVLTGYGAYGMSLTPGFSAFRRSLLVRGVLHVTAHVRGGMEGGYAWYEQGRGADKDNSFNDLIASAEALLRMGIGRAGRLVLHGGSAGGMLVGTAVMRRPELFAGVVADVPFVDVLATMSDPSLPLTPPEWPEWGNPLESDSARRRLSHYTPILAVQSRHYPPILATAGLSDPRVTYWEPAKWIARLKRIGRGGPFLLYTEMTAGHGGPSGRYAGLDDTARIYQFMRQVLNLPEMPRHSL